MSRGHDIPDREKHGCWRYRSRRSPGQTCSGPPPGPSGCRRRDRIVFSLSWSVASPRFDSSRCWRCSTRSACACTLHLQPCSPEVTRDARIRRSGWGIQLVLRFRFHYQSEPSHSGSASAGHFLPAFSPRSRNATRARPWAFRPSGSTPPKAVRRSRPASIWCDARPPFRRWRCWHCSTPQSSI